MNQRKLLALTLAALMLLSLSVPALAEDIRTTTVTATDGAAVDVDGIDLQDESNIGAIANGDGSSITVGGDVDTTGSAYTGEEGIYGVIALEGGTVDVGGNVTGGDMGVFADGDEAASTITVAGDVTATGGYGGVQAGNGTVTVGGNVTATEAEGGVAAGEGGTVSVGGDVTGGSSGVLVQGGTVDVGGNVTGIGIGVDATEGGTVTVGGDVAATDDNGVGIYAYGESTVDVAGSVSGGLDGILTDNAAIVSVGGDAAGSEAGIYVIPVEDEEETGKGQILVEGTVSGDTAAIIVVVNDLLTEDASAMKDNAADIIPDIIVSTLESSKELIYSDLYTDDDDPITVSDDVMAQVMNAITQNIYYIINADGNISVEGDGIVSKAGFDTATEGTVLLLSAADGYEVEESFGRYVTEWVRNDDGSYLLFVARGGDLVFSAKVRAVTPASTDPSAAPVTGSVKTLKNSEKGTFSVRFSHFVSAELDGETVDPANYTVSQASNGLTVFGFTEEFVGTLDPGTHNGTLRFTDCSYNFGLVVE